MGKAKTGKAKIGKARKGPKKKFETMFSAKREFVILGRSPFGSGARKIKVNQDASRGRVEDRRHILHYDEVLKPTIERVVSNLYRDSGFDEAKVALLVRRALEKKGIKRLPRTSAKLMERLVVEINGARDNLIPDRADTNKAIEVVRGYLRKYQVALQTEQFGADAMSSNNARMSQYHRLARSHFPLDGSGGDITEERNRMHRDILSFIDGCASPSELWNLLHDLVQSATFDFSPKITRDSTVKAIAWQKTMGLNEDAPPSQQLDELMAIL